MSELKTTKNPTYEIGTAVWVKVLNRIWWPGIVVDPLTCPQELLEYVRNVEHIAVVKFEQEDKYEVVGVNSQIFLYSCDRKDDFLERGLSLYKNQKKGLSVPGKFDMNNFKADVISIERLIGGDIRIFENLEAKLESRKSLLKSFYTTPNTKKTKKKEVDRKSLPVPKLPRTPAKPASKPRTSTKTNVSNIYMPSTSSSYSCHSQVGCNFTTNRYDNLKRHMAIHKSNTNVVTTEKPPTSSTSNKRKNVKTKQSDIKKQKLQEELLKDWDNDGEEDEELNASELQSSSNVVQSSNEEVVLTSEVPSSSNVQSSNEEVVLTSEVPSSSNVQSSNEKVVQTMSEDIPTESEIIPTTNEVMPTSKILSIGNDVIPTISDIPKEREVQETITSSSNEVFDFNENDNNTPLVELRQSKSDCNSTVDDDDISETFKSRITPEFINNSIFDASPSESLLVQKTTEDSIPKNLEINSSNELAIEIDNQTKSTELLLEKTVNTLDQINNFENSLSCISSSINNSDANILTEDNNVVGVSEISECGSLTKIDNLHKDIQIETNSREIQKVENISTEIDDSTIVEENTNDVDVNQLNCTTIDKDMLIENSCSVDSTSNKMDCEDKIPKKKICLIDYTPKPEWAKDAEWDDLQKNLLKADFVYHEERTYIPPLTTNYVPLKERLQFKRESNTQEQPEYLLDHESVCDIYLPNDDYDGPPYPKIDDLISNDNPATEVCQNASVEESFVYLSVADKPCT